MEGDKWGGGGGAADVCVFKMSPCRLEEGVERKKVAAGWK